MRAAAQLAALNDSFETCRATRRAAFIPFIVAGDPTTSASTEALIACAQGGADVIELGIPYSDPIADGPTVQRAAHRALANGMSFDRAIAMAVHARPRLCGVPLVCFTYYNPVFVRGIERTAQDVAAAGFSGIVIADLPLEESAPVVAAFGARGVAVTLLVAPTTPAERAAAIADACTGFVYVVTRLGVTGAKGHVGEMLRARTAQLRAATSKPLAAGFGIATPAQAAAAARVCDGVVVGSALVELIAAAAQTGSMKEEVQRFCREMAAACRG
ncbi:MAG: tryptophan synthase subunit alpha [Candidatus Eremiobacteraeota bacterium]|nr:tryptophan synthase subunit alpha [Candidatus Eremiobacteraeota bacterium]